MKTLLVHQWQIPQGEFEWATDKINREMVVHDHIVATQNWAESGELGGRPLNQDLLPTQIGDVIRFTGGSGFANAITLALKEIGVHEVSLIGLSIDRDVESLAIAMVAAGIRVTLVDGLLFDYKERNELDLSGGIEGVLVDSSCRPNVTELWRPTGSRELAKVEASGWRAWPRRLPDQPIFYPVLNEEYATEIAQNWNTKDGENGKVGYVTKFSVNTAFLDRYAIQCVGNATHLEYWIPAEELEEFNEHIIGEIEVVKICR